MNVGQLVVVGAVLSASGCSDFRDCSTVDATRAESLPIALSETGLYDDVASLELSSAAIEFKPQFPLWTDGATKRRWLVLPDGAQVDTRDADDWIFPVGTKFFKEFSVDGARVETRMNVRTEQGWTGAAYVWTARGDDASRQLARAEDVHGTEHDVPSSTECLVCHAGRRNFSLGFSATQLEAPVRAQLWERGLLTAAVESEVTVDPVARAALGVLHGNCSHCHNEERSAQAQATACYAPGTHDVFDLSLPHDLSEIDQAPALQTARFFLGGPEGSEVLHRMSRRNQSERRPSMPPLGTERVDDEGLARVEAFIETLPGGRR